MLVALYYFLSLLCISYLFVCCESSSLGDGGSAGKDSSISRHGPARSSGPQSIPTPCAEGDDDTPINSSASPRLRNSRLSLVDIINRLNKSDPVGIPDILLDDVTEDSDALVVTEDNVYGDLSMEYRRTHFISGLLLSEIAFILEGK